MVIVLGIGWGSSFIFNTLPLAEVGPLAVAFLRMATGALSCWAFVLVT